jgi:hypothetical protein
MLADISMKGWTNREKEDDPAFTLDLMCVDTAEIDTIVDAVDKANQFGDAIHWTILINHEYF